MIRSQELAPGACTSADGLAASTGQDLLSRLSSCRVPVLFAGLALWLLISAAWRPLMLPDEGRYVGVAWEMLTSGDWLTPTLNGLPYFHKPPLMYWVSACAMRLFGPHPLAMRAAPMLGAWLMALALWLWVLGPGARTGQRRQAATAVLVLATMPFYYLGGQFANHDMLVGGCLSLAIVAARRAVAGNDRARLGWVILAWAMAALAVLSKGLIGIVIPALVLLPWLAVRRRWRDLAALMHPAGLATFALCVGPWMAAMQASHPGFFDYFVIEQHFRRYTQSSFNNQHGFWFFVVVLPLLTLPASLWLPAALRQSRQGWQRLGLGGETVFAAWWLVVVVGFFSLPHSKLIGYVLPALPPLAWLLAQALRDIPGRRVLQVLGAGAALCLGSVVAIAWKGPPDHADLAASLALHWRAGDRLAYVGDPFFDLRLQRRARQAPAVIDDWDAERIAHQDTWRKELKDAGGFDPAGAATVLWPRAQAWRQRCAAGRLWLAVPLGTALPPGFADAAPMASGRSGALWRVDGPAPDVPCP